MINKIGKSFDSCAADKQGTVYHEEQFDGISYAIVRGPHSLCAYVGVPKTSPLYGRDYNDVPIRCHGGLTYSGSNIDGLSSDIRWFGWDYGHAGDKSFYDVGVVTGEQEWTPDDVRDDSLCSIWDMEALVRLSNLILNDVAKKFYGSGE